jgi:hypothetical protein
VVPLSQGGCERAAHHMKESINMYKNLALLKIRVNHLGEDLQHKGGEFVAAELLRMVKQGDLLLNYDLSETQGTVSYSFVLDDSLHELLGVRVDLDLHSVEHGYVLDFWMGHVLMASFQTAKLMEVYRAAR